MQASVEKMVREVKDRQDIYDCLMRYCRAVDRLDRELLASCYHSGATDDHGAYVGSAEGFIEWVMQIYRDHKHFSHHEITNHYCELDGDVAHAESYFISTTLDKSGPGVSQARGRYIDRFEKRDGRWAIADRRVLVETSESREGDVEKIAPKFYPRDRTDPSYARR